MNFVMWIAIWFGFGVALGTATKWIGLWAWFARSWNENEHSATPASDFSPVPMKFRRLPPPR